MTDSDLSGAKYQTSPELRVCEKDGEVINETSRAHSSPPHAQTYPPQRHQARPMGAYPCNYNFDPHQNASTKLDNNFQ